MTETPAPYGTPQTKARYVAARAVAVHGERAQLDQLQEECCELGAAISHHRRGRDDSEAELLAEIGDALLMVEQARVIFGDHAVDSAYEAAIDKLVMRLAARGVL